MSGLFTRYVVREHIGPFFFGLCVIMLLFILNLLFRDLAKFLSKGIAFTVILEFLYLNLAWMVALAVPMAVLTSTLMAFGRLSADNEITAIKASGVSFYQILPSVLVVSALLAGGLIWFNNHVLPDFNHRARLLTIDIARKRPMINLEPGVYYTDIPDYNILVQKIREAHSISYVENVLIDDQSDPSANTTIRADRGEIMMHQKSGLLEITLYNGEMQTVNVNEPESLSRSDFYKHIIRIPMSDVILKRSNSGFRGDREKSAQALLADIHKNQQRMAERVTRMNDRIKKRLSKYLPLDLTRNSGLRDPQSLKLSEEKREPKKLGHKLTVNDALPTQEVPSKVFLRKARLEQQQFKRLVQTDLNMIKNFERTNNKYMVEVHKKYSIPAACIVFALIGAPLGILARQRGMAAAAISIVFFLLYWACLIGGETLADRQKLSPFLAMWAPNILVGIGGVFLVLRSVREAFTTRLELGRRFFNVLQKIRQAH